MANDWKPWLDHFGLGEEKLKQCPLGKTPLAWALETGLVAEADYVQWASEHYQLPAVRQEYFAQAMDMELIARYSKVYNWNETCYPIAFSKGRLMVGCLQPVTIENSDVPVVFVVAPYQALKKGWADMNAHFQVMPRTQVVTDAQGKAFHEAKEQPATAKPSTDGLNFANLDGANHVAPTEEISAEPSREGVGSLDFGNLDGANHVATTEEISAEPSREGVGSLDFTGIAEVDPSPVVPDNKGSLQNETPVVETTQAGGDSATETIQDAAINQVPSATETIQATEGTGKTTPLAEPDLHFDDPLGVINKDNVTKPDFQIADTQTGDQDLPTLSDLKSHSAGPKTTVEMTTEFDDEETQSEIAPLPMTAPPSDMPPENVISDGLMIKASELKNPTDLKFVVAHMFHHLKRDYQKLMWLEIDGNQEFKPTFVYGHWVMTKEAWTTPVNLKDPNIFRIAARSENPFHGRIHMNPVNENYARLWNANQKPNTATVFPVAYDSGIHAFIVCFDKGDEFHEVGSLKKIENLVSICESSYREMTGGKAAA